MTTPSEKPSKAEIAKAVKISEGAAKVAANAVPWSDVRDGFKVIPTEKDGVLEASVPLDPSTEEGRRNIGLYQEMFAPQFRADAERAAEVRGMEPTSVIRSGYGRKRVQERFAEQIERKHYARRTSIVVPELPWKRKKEAEGE